MKAESLQEDVGSEKEETASEGVISEEVISEEAISEEKNFMYNIFCK